MPHVEQAGGVRNEQERRNAATISASVGSTDDEEVGERERRA